jgi:hypothetical protein
MTGPSAPVTVASARTRATALYERRFAAWVTGTVEPPVFDVPLHPPTQETALRAADAAVQWVRDWREVPGVVWTRRRWANVGDQDVPERLRLDAPADVARFAGTAKHWRTLGSRADEIIERWGDAMRPAVRRHAATLVEHDEVDHARLLAVVDWLVAHPESGLYFRQVPVAGVDSKWLGTRRALVTALVTSMTQAMDLGLRQSPGLVRVRFLDRTLAPGGVGDLAAPTDELDRLNLRPDRVIVVENLESLLALPSAHGVIAVHGSGYAVDRLGLIGWVHHSRIGYWGDLDHDGFAILDRLRAHCSDVTSVLMDESTLLAHRDLWVKDLSSGSGRALGPLDRLTAQEAAVDRLLAELGGVRLEQERIAWPEALNALGVGDGMPSGGPTVESTQ